MTRKALTPPKKGKKTFIKKRARKVSKETRDIPDPPRATEARRVLLEVVVHGDRQEIGMVLGWTEEADGLRASQVKLDARTARGIRTAARQLLEDHAKDVALRVSAVQLYLEKGIPVSKRIRGAILLRQAINLERQARARDLAGKKPLGFDDYDDMSKEVEG
jgi:hypothetical protein